MNGYDSYASRSAEALRRPNIQVYVGRLTKSQMHCTHVAYVSWVGVRRWASAIAEIRKSKLGIQYPAQ